jgi:hypothetical protein
MKPCCAAPELRATAPVPSAVRDPPVECELGKGGDDEVKVVANRVGLNRFEEVCRESVFSEMYQRW